jgi:hypothetical protein
VTSMPPDKPRVRPRQETDSHEDARGDGTKASITAAPLIPRGPAPLRPLPAGRWMGGLLYDPPVPRPRNPEPQPCGGEFGANGKLRAHCQGCAS